MPRTAMPVERKRRLGNPGQKKLPAKIIVAEQIRKIPEPRHPLGKYGLEAWNEIWTAGSHWISSATDVAVIQMLCECEDERAMLRLKVLAEQDWRDRVGLRKLEEFILVMYSKLGFTPTDRGKMGVGEVRPASVLDELRARRPIA